MRYLASDAGIRQFLDIGTGIPNQDNVHGVAQATTPKPASSTSTTNPWCSPTPTPCSTTPPGGTTAYIN